MRVTLLDALDDYDPSYDRVWGPEYGAATPSDDAGFDAVVEFCWRELALEIGNPLRLLIELLRSRSFSSRSRSTPAPGDHACHALPVLS